MKYKTNEKKSTKIKKETWKHGRLCNKDTTMKQNRLGEKIRIVATQRDIIF